MTLKIANFFIKQIIDYNVITYGDFQLSDGSNSNIYYEFEKFNDGKALDNIGFSFLSAAKALDLEYDVIYGAAYKGAFIAIAMSSYAWHWDGLNPVKKTGPIPCVVERKEPKDRNNKGYLVGASIEGKRVLLVDDVVTSGDTIRRSLDIIANYNTKSISLLTGVNRSGIQTIDGLTVNHIVSHQDILNRINYKDIIRSGA